MTESEVQVAVAEVWAEVLGVEGASDARDFFELGGDSLKAIELLFALEQRVGVEVDAGQLLEHPSLGELQDYVASQSR
ncbi:acyl carrier protein [Kribbella solani]|uniref:Acyl carrier protein n=1 Tax=Kribbella solani TaxID=236067 RepID=A0A841DH13_9ACTN|nr:acyl carrier protein [Kribbella solani]MBB5977792.1 acyl carrier protein [Kribbella solani]